MALRTAIAKHLYRTRVPTIKNIVHSPLSQKSLSVDASLINRNTSLRLPIHFYFPFEDKLKVSNNKPVSDSVRLSSPDTKKVIRCSQLQKVRLALKLIQTNSITYTEFVKICSEACSNRDQGLEFAKLLDLAGDVIVLGNVVFLHPNQVAKSMEKLISQSMAIPNDPRRQELEELETRKALIDRKAISQVRGELYCGLGYLILQTLGFMRLTFWELSWDVMEPVCFFVTSFHCVLGYMFFLRTSKEPTFEGYFQRRFRMKQRKLMDSYKFDYEKYNDLCKAYYPDFETKVSGIMHKYRLRS
ncbi:calcium uniporter protein 4, mitochondrial-like [Rutidosis leptorrhynchoides]|uniref:calcium uniporter protein 4, mitochondrial-like n=1 Tax=Rutidosis leptorrhynchoides TaxID=125765 RepID=UPI003A9A636C